MQVPVTHLIWIMFLLGVGIRIRVLHPKHTHTQKPYFFLAGAGIFPTRYPSITPKVILYTPDTYPSPTKLFYTHPIHTHHSPRDFVCTQRIPVVKSGIPQRVFSPVYVTRGITTAREDQHYFPLSLSPHNHDLFHHLQTPRTGVHRIIQYLVLSP